MSTLIPSDPAAARGRVYTFDAAVAVAFLARLAAGETARALLGKAGMPSQRAYAHLRRTDAGFGQALAELTRSREARRLRGLKARYRAWDEAMADRILLAVMRGAGLRKLLASDRAFPCLAVVARWRRQEPVWDRALLAAMAVGRRARWRGSSELMEEVGQRIAMGASLRSLGAEPDMPSIGTLYAWRRRWPAFAEAVAEACDFRDQVLADRILDLAQRSRELGAAGARRELAPLQLRINQLSKRPGWRQARAEREAREAEAPKAAPVRNRWAR